MKKMAILSAGSAVLALTIGLAGCSGASFSGSSLPGSSVAEPTLDMSTAMPDGLDSNAAMGAEESSGMADVVDSKLIVSGDASVVTNDPSQAATDFKAAVEELGGSITSSSESNTDYNRSSSVRVKVPADKYEDLAGQLGDFGKVEYQNSSSMDVGQEYVDLDARVSALEDSLKRLQQLADQAQTTEDLLSAEEMLTNRQAELDSLKQQLQWLDNQVEMSTLSVTFSTETTHRDDGFSWRHAWDLFLGSITAFAYLLVVAVPWLLLLAAVTWVVRLLIRRRRKARGSRVPTSWVQPSDATAPASDATALKTGAVAEAPPETAAASGQGEETVPPKDKE